jgi:phage host-nuclease inhibitor protein Gam
MIEDPDTQATDTTTPAIEWMEDGTPFNPETGEVYSIEELQALGAMPTAQILPSITSRTVAEEVLEIRQKIESKIDGIQKRKAIVIANFDKQIKQQQTRLNWWDFRFKDQLIELTKQLLGGGKKKNYTYDFGTVSSRTSNGTNTITDMNLAVEYMKRIDKTKVKVVESVTVTDLIKTREELENLCIEKDIKPIDITKIDFEEFVESSGPRTNWSIKTGY